MKLTYQLWQKSKYIFSRNYEMSVDYDISEIVLSVRLNSCTECSKIMVTDNGLTATKQRPIESKGPKRISLKTLVFFNYR